MKSLGEILHEANKKFEEENEPQTILGLEVIDHHKDYDPFGVGFGFGQMSIESIEETINRCHNKSFFLAKMVTAIDSDPWLDDADWKEKTIKADEGNYFLLWMDNDDDWLDSFHF